MTCHKIDLMPPIEKQAHGKRYHTGLNIETVLTGLAAQKREGVLLSAYERSGERLTIDEAIRMFGKLKERGYEYLPRCDNCDKTGKCMGHI